MSRPLLTFEKSEAVVGGPHDLIYIYCLTVVRNVGRNVSDETFISVIVLHSTTNIILLHMVRNNFYLLTYLLIYYNDIKRSLPA